MRAIPVGIEMAKSSHSNPPKRTGSDSGAAPLPDRTRVEVSPFLESGSTDRIKVNPDTDHAADKPVRRVTAQPSIIVDDALEARSEPPPRKPTTASRRAANSKPGGGAAADWDEPVAPADDANATRMVAMPTRRPSAADVEDATSAGRLISVEVVVGPDRGIRLPIRGGRMIIGRGDGCDLKLTDTSVSRRHVEVTAGADGLVLRDLGSGNGTKVNGKRETEIEVQHGDEVALGDTVFKIVDEIRAKEEELEAREPEPPPPAPMPRRPSLRPRPKVESTDAVGLSSDDGGLVRSTGVLDAPPPHHLPPHERASLLEKLQRLPGSMKFLAAGGVVVLVLTIFFVISAPKKAGKDPDGPKSPSAANAEQEYETARSEARKLFTEKKYDAALKRAEEALAFKKTTEIDRLISTIERNVKAKKVLNEARNIAARGDFDRAIEKVKDLDPDTDVGDDAKEAAKKWTEQKLTTLTDKIRGAASSGDFDGARALLTGLPFEQQEALRRELADGEVAWKRAAGDRRAQEAILAAARRRKEAERNRQIVDEAIGPVVRKIESGNFEGAAQQCDRVAEGTTNALIVGKARAMKKILPAFGQAYNDGMSKFHGGSYEQAAGSLLRALKLYEDMDIESKLDKTLRDRTAQSLSFKGKGAANRQEYGVAARAYKDALRIDPNSKDAQTGLAAIRRNAEEVYNEGYAIKDRDPDSARKRFKDVVDMVPQGDELAKKAQKRIDELDSGR